jgi:hypothetical protein
MIKKVFTLATVAATVALTGCQCIKKADCGSCKGMAVKTYESSHFYQDNGKGAYDGLKAKQAYYDMMTRFRYPIPPVLKTDQFWTCDFLQHDFTHLGMGGIFWINEIATYGETGDKAYDGEFKGQQFGYLGHDLYLLPFQALPEHNHLGGFQKMGPKMEAWHVRHGSVRFYSEYKGDESKLIADLPEDERPWGYGDAWFRCKYFVDRNAGEVHKLINPEGYHFQQAMGEGAIVSEYATCHNHVQFAKPGMEFKSSE